MRIIILSLLSAIIIACATKPKPSEKPSQLTYRKDSVILIKTMYHDFSQKGNPDKFLICIRGKSLLEGQAIFTITNLYGVEIYCEIFPSRYLLDYGIDSNADISIKENYIKNRFSTFFNENNFSAPAIKPEEVFDESYSKLEIWEDIKEDQTAIGFHYHVGEEDIRSIAYSKKLRKVVLYFNCC